MSGHLSLLRQTWEGEGEGGGEGGEGGGHWLMSSLRPLANLKWGGARPTTPTHTLGFRALSRMRACCMATYGIPCAGPYARATRSTRSSMHGGGA